MPSRVHVLIVDDSITIRAMMTQVLQKDAGLAVAAVASAAEADALLADRRFDVITLDVEMPGMGGLEFLARVKARYDIPVVMLSASTGRGADVRTAALVGGAAGCFDKADAVRRAPELIRLVKNAAHHKARLDREDSEALAALSADG